MLRDLVLQGIVFATLGLVFLFAQKIPQKLYSKLRLFRQRHHLQSKRHFVLGAQILASAAVSPADARRAEEEADRAIALDPTDAACHILKALALELQGFRTSALASMDAALSPLAAKSLSDSEMADALFKRAELRAALDGEDGAAVEADLLESLRRKGGNAKAYGLLGRCYEKKGMVAAARDAYQGALRAQPEYKSARDALTRLDEIEAAS